VSDIFPAVVYLLCFLTSSACAALLGRTYWQSGTRLLLWSALCFLLLAANNFVVVVDLLILPDWDFRVMRHSFSLAAIAVLLFGFIWDIGD
jgi:hypothetical protein